MNPNRRHLSPKPLEHLQLIILGGGVARVFVPRTWIRLSAKPFQHFELAAHRRHLAGLLVPRAGRLLRVNPSNINISVVLVGY